MAAEALTYLTSLAIILLFGILCTLLAGKFKMSNVLLLIVVGIVFNQLRDKGTSLINFPPVFITGIALLALVMIVFDSCSSLKLREFDVLSVRALRLALAFMVLCTVGLSIATKYIFGINSWFVPIIFASLMAGTSPDVVLTMFRGKKSSIVDLLQIESIINTPLIVLIPFMVLEFARNVEVIEVANILSQLAPFLQQFVAGIGAGILIGLIIFKVMTRVYSEILSPIAMITAALLTYILAENLGGNGVLAVTTLGLFVGNVTLVQKRTIRSVSTFFTNSLEILVFVLLGLIITIPIELEFFYKSFGLFLIFLLIRYIAVHFSFGSKYTLKERLFMTLVSPKGIATAVVAITLSTFVFPDLLKILDLILIFFVYSIVLSTIIAKLADSFIEVREVESAADIVTAKKSRKKKK